MVSKFVLLAAIALGAITCRAQTSLPVTYNATEIQGDGTSTCPTNQLRETARNATRTGVRNVIQNNVLPALQGVPCPCMSSGRQVALLNMTDPNQQCPPNWELLTTAGLRTCGRSTNIAGSCDSAFFRTGRTPYNRVCGRVRGYQYCSPNAFEGYNDESQGLDGYYVEGVSITHGSPRTHIWTFAAAYHETYTGSSQWLCPCTNVNNPTSFGVPPFIGQDYFCETGAVSAPSGCSRTTGSQFYTADPLWDGNGCGSTDTCCGRSNSSAVASWFCQELAQSTTDDIEVRICADQLIENEDTPLELVEIYVS